MQVLKQWQDCHLKALAIGTGEASVMDRNSGEKLFKGMLNYLLATGLLTHPEMKEAKQDTSLYAANGEREITCERAGFLSAKLEQR